MNNHYELIDPQLRRTLRAAADAASHGPWQAEVFDGDQTLLAPVDKRQSFIANLTGPNRQADARYLALLDPDQLRDLLDRLDVLAAALRSYQCGYEIRPWALCTLPTGHGGDNHVSEPALRAEKPEREEG